MKQYVVVFVAVCFLCTHCNPQVEKTDTVDGIAYDARKDDPNFQLCNEYVFQYFNDSKGLVYNGEKPALEEAFRNNYDPKKVARETGSIRIRFVVNCKGKTDRFRLLAMDNQYNEKIVDTSITNQLLLITKQLDGWGVKEFRGQPMDYYQYLIFVIRDGKIAKILP